MDLIAWGRIEEDDRIDIIGVEDIKPRETLTMAVRSKDGSRWETELSHSLHDGQITWPMKGSALNNVKSFSSR